MWGFMNDALKLQISAFIDGELPDGEAELLLRRLSQDAALRQQVAQYLEIGRLMRNDRTVPGVDRLRGRIAVALGETAAEPKVPDDVVGSRLMTPATGIAVAATVAALALFGLSQLDGPTAPGFDAAVAIDSAPTYTEPTVEEVLADSPNEQIREYYRRHENSSDELARVVNFELSEDLVEIEPDPRLFQGRRQAIDEDAEDTEAAGETDLEQEQ